MNHNDIRPTLIGVAAGVIGTVSVALAFLAYEEIEAKAYPRRQARARRAYCTDADLAALAARDARQKAFSQDHERTRQRVQAEVRAKFRPELLSPANAGTVLEQLTVPALLTEFRSAVGEYRRARTRAGVSDDGFDPTWVPAVADRRHQLDALRDEYRRRDSWRVTRSPLDGWRLGRAWREVCDHAVEYLPLHDSEPTTVTAGE